MCVAARILSRTACTLCARVTLQQKLPLHNLLAPFGSQSSSPYRLPRAVVQMLEADGLTAPTFEVARQASLAGGHVGAALSARVKLQQQSRDALAELQAGVPQEGVTSTEQERKQLAEKLAGAVGAKSPPPPPPASPPSRTLPHSPPL